MATYNNFADMLTAMQSAIQEILQNEVADVVIEEIKKQEKALVYDSYNPSHYWRRKSLGKAFEVEPDGVDAVRIWDAARPNWSVRNTIIREPDGILAQWINDGKVPNIFDDNDYPWMHKRPLYDEAAKRLRKTSEIKKAAEAGLKARL